MVLSNVIDFTISRRLSVFSQFRFQISAGLTNIGCLAVAAFDLVNCSLSVFWFVLTYTTYGRYTNHSTLMMVSAQVVETSVNVTLNSPTQEWKKKISYV